MEKIEEMTDAELKERVKTAHGYELADLLREQVRRLGYEIKDTKDGVKIRKL